MSTFSFSNFTEQDLSSYIAFSGLHTPKLLIYKTQISITIQTSINFYHLSCYSFCKINMDFELIRKFEVEILHDDSRTPCTHIERKKKKRIKWYASAMREETEKSNGYALTIYASFSPSLRFPRLAAVEKKPTPAVSDVQKVPRHFEHAGGLYRRGRSRKRRT